MEKDESIKQLVQSLPMKERGWILLDHWDADRCATGIAHRDDPRRLVYVSTFRNSPGRYSYECEAPVGEAEVDYKVTATGEDVSREELLAVLEQHLAPDPGAGTER